MIGWVVAASEVYVCCCGCVGNYLLYLNLLTYAYVSCVLKVFDAEKEGS
jgi:hypothetical protein